VRRFRIKAATRGGSKRKTAPKKTRLMGRKPRGDKRQFLVTMGPEVIKAIKTAAIADDKTASELMEEAAKDWRERRGSKAKKA
jgi:hypothetical protein